MPQPHSSPPESTAAWTLEVVRGAHLGQRYALAAAAVVLGNGNGTTTAAPKAKRTAKASAKSK